MGKLSIAAERIQTGEKKDKYTFITVILTILIIFAPLYIFLSSTIQKTVENEQYIKAIKEVGTFRARLEGEITTVFSLLKGISALIRANPDLTHEEFETYAYALYPAGKGIISRKHE